MNAVRARGRMMVYASLGVLALAASPRPAAARNRIEIGLRARILRHRLFEDLAPEELTKRALAVGPMHVRGRVHLSGRIFAQGFHVEEGAEVTFEPGLEIYSEGDVVIDAPMTSKRTAPAFELKSGAGGGPVGANGGDALGFSVSCAQGDTIVNQPIQVLDGDPGIGVTVNTGSSGTGGNGGKGGDVHVECQQGKVTISANIAPGRGGDGGFADVTGADGAPGADGQTVDAACGGDGGASGIVVIRAPEIDFTTDVNGKAQGKIALRPGGFGGIATAHGGKGGPTPDCTQNAGNGGDAIAIGGVNGPGTQALVEAPIIMPATFGAADISGFDESEWGAGGDASAYGGDGGLGASCVSPSGCPSIGRSAGKAGAGGNATATGGIGMSAGQIGGGKGALRKRKQSAAETPPGDGGHALARGGAAGVAGNGESAMAPGSGGTGGQGGKATATGGMGGSSTLGHKPGTPLAGGQGPLTGAAGGDADARGGDGGDSGNGGDCCNNPGGGGGAGGPATKGGKAVAVGGRGGHGHKTGPKGASIKVNGAAGAAGNNGAGCPLPPVTVTTGVTMDASLENSTISLSGTDKNAHLNALFTNTNATDTEVTIEICCDNGKIIYGPKTITIPGTTPLGSGTFNFAFFVFPPSQPENGREITIKINLKLVKTLRANFVK